jgi:hypothetical protein
MEKVNSRDLSIIILSYKSKSHLAVLLPSIFGSKTKYFYEVIVVDNDSQDGTVEWIKENQHVDKNRGRGFNDDLVLIENQNNGFSKGNNLGITKSNGRYILLLNPDTKLESDALEIMLDFMEQHQEVGISGCKLIKADGKLDLACRRRFPNPANSFKRLFLGDNTNYNYSDVDENQSMEVDSVVGAFMLVRRSLIDKVGLLDENFFMYGEDLDYCWRCKAAGFKVWYYPKAVCHHYKGQSSAKTPFKSLKVFHESMWIFYQKHYAKDHFFVFNWLIFTGIYFRLTVLSVINLFKANPVVSR